MIRALGFLQLLAAAICLLLVAATAVNLGWILMRPETISVANSMIGQSVLIICLLAASRILAQRGLAKLRTSRDPGDGGRPQARP